MTTGWASREDVTEELVEIQGWVPDEDYPGMFWRKGSCVFTLLNADGDATLEDRENGVVLAFSHRVPAPWILAVCVQATAPCQVHGTLCEPDDHIEPPTVNGEVL